MQRLVTYTTLLLPLGAIEKLGGDEVSARMVLQYIIDKSSASGFQPTDIHTATVEYRTYSTKQEWVYKMGDSSNQSLRKYQQNIYA